jgi:hypothetical protein
VWNRSLQEGSIVEAFVADECLTFRSNYIDDVESRNKSFSDEQTYGVDIFGHGVNFTSASEPLSKDSAIDQMVWFVLNNSIQVEKFVQYVLLTILCSVAIYFLSFTYANFVKKIAECSKMN